MTAPETNEPFLALTRMTPISSILRTTWRLLLSRRLNKASSAFLRPIRNSPSAASGSLPPVDVTLRGVNRIRMIRRLGRVESFKSITFS
jgi:hypothetical protein